MAFDHRGVALNEPFQRRRLTSANEALQQLLISLALSRRVPSARIQIPSPLNYFVHQARSRKARRRLNGADVETPPDLGTANRETRVHRCGNRRGTVGENSAI
jgi:hypothetical protein